MSEDVTISEFTESEPTGTIRMANNESLVVGQDQDCSVNIVSETHSFSVSRGDVSITFDDSDAGTYSFRVS